MMTLNEIVSSIANLECSQEELLTVADRIGIPGGCRQMTEVRVRYNDYIRSLEGLIVLAFRIDRGEQAER